MDFITLIYELKNRELDNALLLKCELEERGYKVNIKEKTTNFYIIKKPKILIVPNLYNSENFEYYTYRFNAYNIPVVNLQYEQICSMNKKSIEYYSISGSAKKAYHLCWGKTAYERLINNNISNRNVSITGAIHLDFLRKEFCDFWETKESLAKIIGIPKEKTWILYISGFAFANNPYVESSVIEELGNHYKNIGDFHKRNRIEILKWFDNILEKSNDIVVIYRPHPMEWNTDELDNLLKKYKNQFIIMAEFNIKQWILVSDIITTWYSTSIAECYVSEKNIFLLRPEIFPLDFDAEIYKNCKSIKEYNKFEEIIIDKIQGKEKSKEFPIQINKIKEYYDIRDDIPSYIRIADQICIEINKKRNHVNLKEKSYWSYKKLRYFIKEHVIIKQTIKNMYKVIYKAFHISINNNYLREKYALIIWEKEAIDNKKTILEVKNKLKILKIIVKKNKI